MHDKLFPSYIPGLGPGCCISLPIKQGISLVALYSFADTLNQAQMLIRALQINSLVGICCLPVVFFMAINCLFFIEYYKEDTIDTRRRLVIGSTLSLFANILLVTLLSASCMFNVGMVTMLPEVLFSHMITISLWIFCLLACRHFVRMGEMYGLDPGSKQAQYMREAQLNQSS